MSGNIVGLLEWVSFLLQFQSLPNEMDITIKGEKGKLISTFMTLERHENVDRS